MLRRQARQLTFQAALQEHNRQEQEALQQKSLPGFLLDDGWRIDRVWCHIDRDWRWQCSHAYTTIQTDTFTQQLPAIDQALRLAFFYEVMPYKEWILYSKLHPKHLLKLPTLLHWHDHDHAAAKVWHEEYINRHPTAHNRSSSHNP